MIYFNIIILLLVFLLGYQVFTLRKNIKQSADFDKAGLILPKIKEKISVNNVDKDKQVLKNIIESAKLEGWKFEITRDGGLIGSSYSIDVISNKGDIRIRSVLRWYSDKVPKVGYFIIQDLVNGQSISYDVEEGEVYELIVKFIWEKINEDIENQNLESEKIYKEILENLDSKLITLKREKKLKKLFQKN
jgi:hypothetical protein